MGKKSSKTVSKPWGPAQPHLLGAASTISDTVNRNQPMLEGLSRGISDNLPWLSGKAFGDDPGLGAAQQYGMDVLGGKYLDQGNPYLEQMIGRTSDDVSDRVNSLFGRSGASLGTQHAGTLTRELAGAQNQLRYQDYGNERNAMAQAAGQAPSLFASQFAGVPAFLGASQTAGELPFTGLDNLGMMGSLFGGYGSQTSKQAWGPMLMQAAASAAMAASDRRLKTNIKLVRRDPDGLGWYNWNWRTAPDGPTEYGVIADEVEKLRPWAYVKGFVGGQYDGVNYAALGSL